MEADRTDEAIEVGSTELEMIAIGVLVRRVLADSERARRMKRTERAMAPGQVWEERPQEGSGRRIAGET